MRAERDLRESAEKFSVAFHASPDLIAITRLSNGIVLEVNEGFTRLLGHARAEAIGKTTTELSIWAEPRERVAFVARLRESGRSDEFEVTLRRRDGSLVTGIDSARTIELKGEVCVLSVIHDITERRQAEEALRESEERQRSILEHGGVGVAYFSLDGRILLLNRKAVQNLGGSDASEFVGKTVTELFGDEAGSTYLERIRRTAASSEALEFVDHVVLPSGSYWLSSIHSRSLNAAGDPDGVQVYAQDITAHKQAEDEVRRHAEQMRRAVAGAVLVMSRMVESRDPYTGGHERRVAELATAIGAELGLADEALDALHLAATIHDVGKIAVPAEILAKPGRLSDMEFELVKAHATTGFEFLADVECDFGSPVAEMVRQHHERLDGSGYPRGLSGHGDPARGPHPRRRRRRRGDVLSPALPRGARPRGRAGRGARTRRGHVRRRRRRRVRAALHGARVPVHALSRPARRV